MASSGGNLISYLNHSKIKRFWVTSYFKSTVFVDIRKPGKHVSSWDSHLVEHQEAIISRVVSKLAANVANFNTWQRIVSLQVSNLNHKRLDAEVIFVYLTPSKN